MRGTVQDDPGFFPAFSLEKGEAVAVNLGQSAFVHPPPEGFKAIIEARPGGVAAPQPRPDDTGREGGDKGGDGEEYPRDPIDLEQFSCATDLAERFGPNRLKVCGCPGRGGRHLLWEATVQD